MGILLRNLFSLSSLSLSAVDGSHYLQRRPGRGSAAHRNGGRYFQPSASVHLARHRHRYHRFIYDNPREVGADRLVNAVAAWFKYGGPAVVVDLGNHHQFRLRLREWRVLGGLICPGIGMSIGGLFARTARLPMVDFREPEKLIGSNTVGSIQSGLYYGFISLIDGIIERILAELGPSTKAIATGGQAQLIARTSRMVNILTSTSRWKACA